MAKSIIAKNGKYLSAIHTASGIRSVYDSVCYCNRCGLCAGTCPSYLQTRQETFSPRGRNQAFRFLLEGKLNLHKETNILQQLAYSCSLCGKCTQVCPAKVPTAQHVLELRRRLPQELLPPLLQKLLRLRESSPRLFYQIARAGLWIYPLSLDRLFSKIPGLSWLTSLRRYLPNKRYASFHPALQTNPELIFLPSLEAEILRPDITWHIYNLVNKKFRVQTWQHTATGLFEYIYGDLSRARKLLHRLIMRHAHSAKGNLPLLTDSMDVYTFLKQAPQLFAGWPKWEQQAHHFASCVHFITDYIAPVTSLKANSFAGPVYFLPSALFGIDEESLEKIQKILGTLFKKNFVKCGYMDAALPPFGYGLGNGQPTDALFLQVVRQLAGTQIKTVFVTSVLAELELDTLLRRFYPQAHVYHIGQLER